MSASKYLFAQFYDLLNSCVEHKIIPYRKQTASRCVGNTLEIGAGTGANIPFYKNVTSLSLVEPDKHMRSKLITKFGSYMDSISLIENVGEHLESDDNSFDCVCTTLTLCMVKDPQKVISEICRVLKPGGTFYFYEHVVSKNRTGKQFQNKLNPFWEFVTTGCNLNRDIVDWLKPDPFTNVTLKEFDLKFPLGISIPNIVGEATK